MRYAILDTSVYIDWWTGSLGMAKLDAIREACIVRQSAVVLSELRRGARTGSAASHVEALKRMSKTSWAPTEDDWWRAGALVRTIGDANDWEVGKRREFQNDVLIALTARRQGALLVTRNRADFELLVRPLALRLMVL